MVKAKKTLTETKQDRKELMKKYEDTVAQEMGTEDAFEDIDDDADYKLPGEDDELLSDDIDIEAKPDEAKPDEELDEDADASTEEPPAEESPAADELISLDEYGERKIKTKIDGVEGEVALKDLIKSHQLEGHLTKRLQNVAERERQITAMQQQMMQQQQAPQQVAPQGPQRDSYMSEEDYRIALQQHSLEQTQRQTEERQVFMENQFRVNMAYNELLRVHPDAMELDNNPDFIEFRMKNAPMVNNTVVQQNPAVLVPVMTWYKQVNEMQEKLSKSTQVTEGRKKELELRKEKQVAAKKKARVQQPSTSSIKTDDGEGYESRSDYLKRMEKNRAGRKRVSL